MVTGKFVDEITALGQRIDITLSAKLCIRIFDCTLADFQVHGKFTLGWEPLPFYKVSAFYFTADIAV